MRIVTLDHETLLDLPVADTLRELLASTTDTIQVRLIAKLLELVCFLESNGPAAERIHSFLHYQPGDRLDLFLKLFTPNSIVPRKFPRTLEKVKASGPDTQIEIRPDSYDYSSLGADCAAVLHYRLNIRQAGSKRTSEFRTDDCSVVLERIKATFGLKDG